MLTTPLRLRLYRAEADPSLHGRSLIYIAPSNRPPGEHVMRTIHHFVGGQEVQGKSGRFADVFNPATGEVQAKVALASKAELDAAVRNAAEAFPKWAATPPLTRSRILFRFKQLC